MPQVVSAESGEVLTLAEAKLYLQVEDDSQDTQILEMLQAARSEAERIARRTFRTSATRVEVFRDWQDPYYFPNPPLLAVISVKYYDISNVQQTVVATNYTLVSSSHGQSYIEFDPFYVKPILYDRRPDRVEYTFTTGYTLLSSIPPQVKQGIKILLWDNFHGESNPKSISRARSLIRNAGYGFYA